MGRPSKYHEDIPALVREYVDSCDEEGAMLPTIEGLADFLDLHRDTIFEWAKHPEKAEFSDALEALSRRQKKYLLHRSLEGSYNPTIAKLMLSHNHGMRETTASEISGPGGGAIPIAEVRREIVQPDNTNG